MGSIGECAHKPAAETRLKHMHNLFSNFMGSLVKQARAFQQQSMAHAFLFTTDYNTRLQWLSTRESSATQIQTSVCCRTASDL
jgi:hypothetical protein